jgi:opacity protein-like surface antigen
MCSTAAAADLLVTDVPAEVAAPEASSINGYVQLMGGWTMPNSLSLSAEGVGESIDFDAGWALGGTLGVETPIDGVSVEVDVLRTWADAAVEGEGAGSLISTSLMANAVYSIDLNDMFSLYGGAGLGIIALELDADEVSTGISGSGAGYQVFAGIQAAVADNVALTLEGRYQSSIDDIEMTVEGPGPDSIDAEFNRTSILAGVLFSF